MTHSDTRLLWRLQLPRNLHTDHYDFRIPEVVGEITRYIAIIRD